MSRKDYTNNLLLQYYQASKDDTEVGEVLEYIELDGTQYYDTGVLTSLNLAFEGRFKISSDSDSSSVIFGGRSVQHSYYWGNELRRIFTNSKTQTITGYQIPSAYNNLIQLGIEYDFSMNGTKLVLNNSIYNIEIGLSIPNDRRRSIYIGASNTDGTVDWGLQGTLSCFRIYDNGTLIRDYIPFLDAHLRPCLYDRVTKIRLYHKNISGNTVPTYKRWNKYNVEYLESTGTQYIDSGFTPINNKSYGFELKAKNKSVIGTLDFGAYFGGRVNSGQKDFQLTTYTLSSSDSGTIRNGSNAAGYGCNAEIPLNEIFQCSLNNGIYKSPNNISTNVSIHEVLGSKYSFYIFGLNNSNNFVQSGLGCIIYNLKFYQSNTLVRNFIPTVWYDESNNNHPTPCMYDEVYNKLYLNAGTGEFLAGKPTESVVYGADVDMSDLPSNQATRAVILNKSCDKPTSQYRYQYTTQRVLPVHDRIMGCVMSNVSEGTIAYYLDKSNSNYKFKGTYRGISSDGSPSVLTGGDGDVFEEYMPFYIRVDKYTDSNNHPHKVYLISTKKFRGAHIYPLFRCGPGGKDVFIYYAGKFRSVLCNPDGTVKTHANTAPPAYANGDKLRSIAGAQPAGNIGRQNSRKAHGVTGGTNVHFLFGSMIKILMTIENANLNEQEAISDGFVNMSSFAYSQMRLTGRTVGFGEGTGSIEADDADSSGVDYDIVNSWNSTAKNNHSRRIVAVCYRGLENPWGSQWEIEDGFQKNQNNLIDRVYLNTNLWFDRDETHDETVNIYSWINGTTYLYTTSETPAVNDRSYTNNTLASYKNVVTAYDSENDTITVANVVYTRTTANDTTRVMRAWYNADNDIRCYHYLSNPIGGTFYTLPTCNVIYSTFHHSYGNFSQSGYWMTTDTDKYVSLDSTLTPPVDSQNVFPIDGTGDAYIWVPHDFPKYDHYPSNFDDLTLFPLPPVWWNTSQLKSLSDRVYNNADAGPRGCFRGGSSLYALSGGCSIVFLYSGVTYANANSGFRLAKSKKISESEL